MQSGVRSDVIIWPSRDYRQGYQLEGGAAHTGNISYTCQGKVVQKKASKCGINTSMYGSQPPASSSLSCHIRVRELGSRVQD
ncbi:hypothetical protein IF1G_00553 [Cordyceps javanica]|uniref:Uncharacterized protein n=1 Tax=Cordyceps javanica TaxID=43265 RepID=A0A545VFX6_9HYPO|nr:hypothetical protein IF1G_00553 [Cordyceps javanica]